MPSNHSKYTPEFREDTARYIVNAGNQLQVSRKRSGSTRIRGAVLQQKTYAFVPGLYESGRIPAGAQCLKRKEDVSI